MNPREMLTHVMQAYQSGEEPEKLYALAGKYWRIMLSVEVLLFLLAIAGGAYMLLATFFNLTLGKAQGGALAGLDRNKLSQVVNGLSARQALFLELQKNPPPIPDPYK
jgi:hypothetical protein